MTRPLDSYAKRSSEQIAGLIRATREAIRHFKDSAPASVPLATFRDHIFARYHVIAKQDGFEPGKPILRHISHAFTCINENKSTSLPPFVQIPNALPTLDLSLRARPTPDPTLVSLNETLASLVKAVQQNTEAILQASLEIEKLTRPRS